MRVRLRASLRSPPAIGSGKTVMTRPTLGHRHPREVMCEVRPENLSSGETLRIPVVSPGAADTAAHLRLAKPLADLLAQGEHALWQRGDLRASRALFETAYRRSQHTGDPYALGAAALGFSGSWVGEYGTYTASAVALDRLQRALSGGAGGDTRLMLRLRSRLAAEVDYRLGEHSGIMAEVERARQEADPVLVAETLSLAHQCLTDPEYGSLRRRVGRDLLAESARTRRPRDLLAARLWRTVDSVLGGSPHAAESLGGVRALLSRNGNVAIDHWTRAVDVMFEIRAGRFARAAQLAQECYDAGLTAGQSAAPAWHATQLITLNWYQGKIADALPMIEQIAVAPSLSSTDFSYQPWLAVARAVVGDHRHAHSAVGSIAGHGQSLSALPRSATRLVALYGLVEAAFLLGDRGVAGQVYGMLLPFASLPVVAGPAVSCFGSVEHALGLARLTLGDDEAAVGHLRRAVAHNTALGHFPAAAVARHRLSVALARSAVPALRAEARGQAERARREAAELGVALVPVQETSAVSVRVHAPAPEAPACAPGAASGVPSTHAPIARRRGRDWEIQALGRTARVGHCRGLAYLAVLFANPGREISALELATGLSRGLDTPSAHFDTSLHRSSGVQAVVDERAMLHYRQRIRVLQQEIEAFDAQGERDLAARAREELQWLQEQLRSSTGLGGRARSFPNAEERARISVCKAIYRALSSIANADPEIGVFVATGVRTGQRCSYVPELTVLPEPTESKAGSAPGIGADRLR